MIDSTDIAQKIRKAEIIKELFDPNVEFSIEPPTTPTKAMSLMEAVKKNLLPAVTKLLSRKADVNQSNKDGDTPLHLAARNGNLELIALLLEHKANINARIPGGIYNYRNTPLLAAIILEREHPDIRIAFNEKQIQDYYNTIRHKVVSTLLKSKADVTVTDSYGKTPLSYAVREESLDLVSLLKEFGATANTPDTPLILAVKNYFKKTTPFVFKGCKGPHKNEILKNREKIIQALLDPSAINLLSEPRSYPRRTALHEATAMGALDLILLLLANGADLSVGDEWGDPPLSLAIKEKQIASALTLIEGKADVNAISIRRWGGTNVYLKQAAGEGSVEFVKLLLENKANVDVISDDSKITALHLAAEKLDLACIKALLAAKASVNTVSVYGTTPLHVAITQQHYASSYYDKPSRISKKISKEEAERQAQRQAHCVTALLQAKAEVNASDGKNYNALQLASIKGLRHLIPILAQAGANHLPNKEGDTPLVQAIKQGSFECVQALLEAKASLKTTGSFGRTPLHWAANEGMVDCISLFCAKGLKVNFTDDMKAYEKTPLYEAIHAIPRDPEAHHYATVYRLLELKASVNYTDSYGGTPLHQAAGKCVPGLIRALIARDKGLLNAFDNCQKTPLHRAIECDQDSCVRVLIESKADMSINFIIRNETDDGFKGKSLIEYAAAMNAERSIPLLLKYREKADQTLVGKVHTPLMLAVRMGKLNSCRALLKSKPNRQDLQARNAAGYNLLQAAALKGRTEIIPWLIDQEQEFEFDVNEKTILGDDSPLILAAHEGFFDCARMLLEARADVNDIDSKGNTALHWAAIQGHYQMFPVLTSYGADIHLHNDDEKSPLALCKNKESIEFLQINETVKPIFDPVYLEVLSEYIEEQYIQESYRDHLLNRYSRDPKLRNLVKNAVNLAFDTIFLSVLEKLKQQRSLLNFSPVRDAEAVKKDLEQWVKIIKDTLIHYLHDDYLNTRSEAVFWKPYIELILFLLEAKKEDTEELSLELLDNLCTQLPSVLWYKCLEYFPGIGSKLEGLFDGNSATFITAATGGAGSDVVELSDNPKAYLKSLDKNSPFNYYKVVYRHDKLIGERCKWLIGHLNQQYQLTKSEKALEERYKPCVPSA